MEYAAGHSATIELLLGHHQPGAKQMRTEPANQNKAPTADYFFYAMGQKVRDNETGKTGTVMGRMEREDEVDFFLVQPDDGAEAEWLSDLILRAA